ncbi:MAG: hypothetical protein HKP28_10335, partial [Winogradskyella sp.]|nr:hypothetical protein [Winogradskyella sp.]
MKTRITLLLVALFVSFNISFAQQDEECMNNLSIFDSYVKSKKYDDAYGPWKLVREKCPKFNRAIYVHGEKILKHKIDNSAGGEQVAFVKDLMLLYDQSNEYFASKHPKGEVLGDKAQLMYKHRKALNATDAQIYDAFDKAFTEDLDNFKSPQGLYTYFSLVVDLYDAGKKTAQQMFDKYDDVNDKIEVEVENASQQLNKLNA